MVSDRQEVDAPRRPWRVLVFARAPLAGLTKTRLIPALGAEGAARLHGQLLARMLAVANAAGADTVELWCAAQPVHASLQSLAERFGATIRVQAGEDLGARMRHAACQVLAEGALPVLVGSDIAVMDANYLRAAHASLTAGAEAVLGPAEDGGYVLIALSRDLPAIFQTMPWSTKRVFALTRQRLMAAGVSWQALATLWDVDRPEDLARLREVGMADLLDAEYAVPRLQEGS